MLLRAASCESFFKFRPPIPGLLETNLVSAVAQKREEPSWAIDYAAWPFEECLQILISRSFGVPYPLSSNHLDAACFNIHKLKTARFLVFLLSQWQRNTRV